MDDIRKDVDVIRAALARSLCSSFTATSAKTTTREDGREQQQIGDGERTGECCQMINVTPVPVADVTDEKTLLELASLREQVAALITCEVDKARLEVELASREAAVRQSAESQQALQQQVAQLQAQLQRALSTSQEERAELVVWRERHERLQREADALRRELDALAGQCDRLETAVAELRGATQLAGDENMRLHATIIETRRECDALRLVKEEHDALLARELALRGELEAAQTSAEDLREYLVAARAEIDARRHFWAAVQEEHVALQEAFVVARETVGAWEARFVAERPPLPVVHAVGVAEDTDGVKGNDLDCVEPSSEAHMAALEAKIVDLALHLREQRDAAETANECYAALEATVTRECRELFDARRTLAAHRPEWTLLPEVNLKLQAELLACENHVEALQEILVSLLDEYTEQSLYCFELETQLAVKVTQRGVSETFFHSNTSAPRRSTALHLLHQQQRKEHLKLMGSDKPR